MTFMCLFLILVVYVLVLLTSLPFVSWSVCVCLCILERYTLVALNIHLLALHVYQGITSSLTKLSGVCEVV